MNALFAALSCFASDRQLRRLCLRPLWITIPLFGLLSFTLFQTFVPKLSSAITQFGLPGWLGTVAYLLIWWTIASSFFVAILMFIAGWAFDGIARRTEELINARPAPGVGLSPAEAFKDGLARMAVSLGLGFLALVLGFFLPVIGAVLILGTQLTLDTTAPAMQRRGMRLRDSMRAVRKLPGVMTYLLPIGMLATLPVINALLMPLFVIAGTILTAQGKQSGALDDHVRSVPPPLPADGAKYG